MIEVGDNVTWLADGVKRTGKVLRVEVIQSKDGEKRCLTVHISGDRSARAYRFINETAVIKHQKN